jgi:hypothetical protein
MKYAIRYRYPGSDRGVPVGIVYALRVRDVIPGYPRDVWSYSTDPKSATRFSSRDEAEQEAAHHNWPESAVVEVPGA